MGRPPTKPVVRYHDFMCQAADFYGPNDRPTRARPSLRASPIGFDTSVDSLQDVGMKRRWRTVISVTAASMMGFAF